MAAIHDQTVDASPQDAPVDPHARGVTFRSVAIALVLLPVNAYWVTQMAVVRYEGHPTTVSLFFNCIFALALLLALNSLARRVAPKLTLHRNELIVIYVMLGVGSSLAGHDTIQILAPQLACAYEGATEENKWEEIFHPYLPEALFVTDPNIYDPAFIGSSSLYQWDHLIGWGKPILLWTSFIVVLLFMMLCFNTIFRSRWMDREKLTYPIVHLPLEMTSERSESVFRSKYMWIGFGVAALIDSMNGLHGFLPAVPEIKVRVVQYDQYMSGLFRTFPWNAMAGTRMSLYPFAVGMGMLLPTDLAFSCWFFYIFWRFQRLGSAILGLNKIPGFPYVEEQSCAAYFGLCLFALWMGRAQIKAVLVHAFKRTELDDSKEPMPYSWATWGLILGSVFLIMFSYYIRMSIWIAVLFFAFYWMISLAVTRIRAELGPPAHDLQDRKSVV